MYKVSIPDISKEELLARYKRIKPIVEIDGKKYFLREFTEKELTDVSYIWNAAEDKRELVDMSQYVPRLECDFECIHEYGHYALFKPSIAEVLAQIPERELKYVDAFEIIESPKTSEDFNKNKIVFDNGFHISKVRLYTSKYNPNVAVVDF